MLNKKGIIFTVSALAMSLVTMLANLVTIRWISPELMGIWNAYFIFVTYIYLMQLGVINGLSRELPFFLGKKKNNIAIGIAQTSLSVVGVITFLTIVFGSFFLIYFNSVKNVSNEVFFTAVSIVILMAVQFYTNYLLSTFRSNNSFLDLSKIYIVLCVVILGSLILVKNYGYLGHVARMPLIAFTQLLLLHLYRPLRIVSKFRLKFFKLLTSTGIPLFVFGYLTGIANTFNRLIILQLGTTLEMGLYSPAIAINTVMRLIPVTLSQYFYPKFSYIAGQSGSEEVIWKMAKKISLLMGLILTVIAVIGYFIVPHFIAFLFPNYIEGTFAAQLALIAGVFSGASIGFTTSLNTLKAFKHIGALAILRAVLFYGLIFGFAISGNNVLDGVAYGVLVSEFVYFVLAFLTNYHYFKIK